MNFDKKIGIGMGVLILYDGKILLGKRNEDPTKASSLLKGAGTWTMPGGKYDFGESFEEGAKRETLEETGLTLLSPKIICVNNDMVETAHFVTIGILCKKFKGKLEVMEPDKIGEWHWFHPSNLPSPMYFPSERILDNYLKQKFYISRKI